ncbi:hypothetical protein QBC35DRAFT_202607 [Podospora australis]|uniref:Uncharacterized protein n=1 Tax=Podospora australis TaxID=1536484 RepID=A0AAN7ANN4_9PEZI|nr:hypothetical protein QBC35DRAFT_202607 [Podospora australis]
MSPSLAIFKIRQHACGGQRCSTFLVILPISFGYCCRPCHFHVDLRADMPPKNQSRLPLSCAEDITLLSQFTSAPSGPQANQTIHSQSLFDPGRVLPFECEVSLASTLAFLAGISDDPGHVTALCVEELAGRQGVRILLAINKDGSRPTNDASANDILGEIQDGLKRIFSHLAQAGTAAMDGNLEVLVLIAVVELCRKRIFSRIGSQRYKNQYTRVKNFFGSPIRQIIEALGKLHPLRKHKPEIKTFINTASSFVKLLDKLEASNPNQAAKCLQEIVRAASQLRENTDFDHVFAGLVTLQSSTKTGFVTRLSKLARYYESVHFLVKLAGRSGLFKSPATISIVSLEPQYLPKGQFPPTAYGLNQCVARYSTGGAQTFGVSDIARILRQGVKEAQTSFANAVTKQLHSSKIHAEVQLVAYYELHPVARKPRVICSSKDACFLCNQFVQQHGVFHIPKTHGNLYTNWRVPPIRTLNDAHDRLDQSLQTHVRTTVQQFEADPERRVSLTRNDNESTIFAYSELMATLEGIVPPAAQPPVKPVTEKKKKKIQQLPAGDSTVMPGSVEQAKFESKVAESQPHGSAILNSLNNSSPESSNEKCQTHFPESTEPASGNSLPPRSERKRSVKDLKDQELSSPNDESGVPSPVEDSIRIYVNKVPEIQSQHPDLAVQTSKPTSPEPIVVSEPPECEVAIPASSKKDTNVLSNDEKPLLVASIRSLANVQETFEGVCEGRTSKLLSGSEHSFHNSSQSSKLSTCKSNQSNLGTTHSIISNSTPRRPTAKSVPSPDSLLAHPDSQSSPPRIDSSCHYRDPLQPLLQDHKTTTVPRRSQDEYILTAASSISPIPSTVDWGTNTTTTPSTRSSSRNKKRTREILPKMLRRGEPTYVRLDRSRILPCYTTGKLNIFLDSLVSRSSKPTEARIEWLDRDRARAIRKAKPRNYHNVLENPQGVDFDGGSSESIYLSNGKDVVMVEIRRL